MNSSLTGLIKSYLSLRESEQNFVLATIIETAGSTYRKPSARMLISRTGQFYGLLGGGCFEADLLEHAYKVFETKQPRAVYYDMRAPEDLIWGLGLGCNGAVRIWLEYLSEENDFSPISLIQQTLATKSPCALITVCETENQSIAIGEHYIYSSENELYDIATSIPEFKETALETIASGISGLHEINVDSHPVKAFFAFIAPPPHLLIIGGGPDAVPVTQFSKLLGWEVTVVDYRETYSKPDNFPDANHVVRATPEQLLDHIKIDTINAVVLMTHKYEYDLRYLKYLTHPALKYVGLLGPVARKNELLLSAGDEVSCELEGRVYGPVGLELGEELPEEIAYSMIAEIQTVLNGRSGQHLSVIKSEPLEPPLIDKLSSVVLAAGGSTRFGALKQLLEYNGQSLLKRIVTIASQALNNRVIVVHGPKATKCQREVSNLDVINIVNSNWEKGFSTSLAISVESLPTNCEAVLVLLCDQPLIENDHIEQLVTLWLENPEKIIASSYAETTGVPVIIPKQYFPDIFTLKGDEGAKTILARYSDNMEAIPVPEAEFDIDTKEDFTQLLKRKMA